MSDRENAETQKAQELLERAKKQREKNAKKLEEHQLKKLDQAIEKLQSQMDKGKSTKKAARTLEETCDVMFNQPSSGNTFFEHAKTIFTAILIALVLRTFFVEPFKIPSGSMIPTLAIGDHIFVNKLSYGLWIPFAQKKWRVFEGPKRGEVIVFINPVDPSRDMVKRVIGLPGDVIEVKNNIVTVNGKPLPQTAQGTHKYLDRATMKSPWSEQSASKIQETLFQKKYITLHHKDSPSPLAQWSASVHARQSNRPWGPQVKAGHVFVMGDNRDRSSDSRDWGLVPIKNIKGRAFLIWLSYGGGKGFRWKRIFNLIR